MSPVPVDKVNNADDDRGGPDYQLIPDLPLMFQNLLFASATFFGAWFWIRGVDHVQQPSRAAKAALLGAFPLDSTSWRQFAATFAILVGLILLFFFAVHLYGVSMESKPASRIGWQLNSEVLQVDERRSSNNRCASV